MDGSLDSSLWLTSESSASLNSELELSQESDAELESATGSFMDDSLDSSSAGSERDDELNGTSRDNVDQGLHQPLYDGAKLSTFDSYLMLMHYALRHGLTKQAVSDLLLLVGAHLPTESVISHYKLKKFFLNMYKDISFSTTHYCCSACHSPLEAVDATCPNGCDGPAMDFLTISLEAQLKRKLQDPAFWSHLQKRFERVQDPGRIRDVLDGKEYLKHKDFLSERGNVSLTVNTDGVSMFKSSSISLWPIWVAINELPPHVRFNKSNLLLAGLWFGEVKPTMTTFLSPFIKEANSLSSTGFSISTPEGDEITARARLLMCSVDLPAKAMVLNMKQYNGCYGCSHCEDKGIPRPSTHLHRNWPHCSSSTQRTHDGILHNAKEALKNGESDVGITGASVLSGHKHFNLCTGVVIDVMHCVFLGVMAKTLMGFWFGVAHHSAPYSLRRKLSQCDERLGKISVPHDFSRTPRSLTHVKTWKASEYRSWLLCYSLPVLYGLLPDPYFTHYALLVSALHIVLGESISLTALSKAEQYLDRFYAMFSALYSDNGCTMNVHLLKHIPDTVRNWGPLWCYSCFAFESMNGHIKAHFHGTKSMNAQLAFSYVMLQVLPRVPHRNERNLLKLSDCTVLGRTEPVTLDPTIRNVIYRLHSINAITGSKFVRATVQHCTYHSRAHQRTVRNSYTVCYVEGGVEKYAFIEYFVCVLSTSLAVVTPLIPSCNFCYPERLSILSKSIIPVAMDSSVTVIPINCLLYKCVCIDLGSFMFIVRLPNQLYGD